jgi:hypothetical protein
MKNFLIFAIIVGIFAALGKMDGDWLAIGLIFGVLSGWIWF